MDLTFLFFICLNIFLYQTLKDINEFRREQMNALILKKLSPILIYKVNNIIVTAFKIVLYLLLILIPFITFRYVQLTNSDYFFLLNFHNFTFLKILKTYAAFITIIFLFLIIKSLLSHELIKLHYSFYRYRIYFYTIDSMRMYSLTIFNPFIRRIDFILKKDIDRYDGIKFISHKKFYLWCQAKVAKSPTLKSILSKFSFFLF